MFGTVAVFIVCTGWISGHFGGTRTTELFSNVAQIVVSAYAAITCTLAARRVNDRPGRGWLLFGAATLAWACGQLVWTWREDVQHLPVVVPSLADLGYLALVPLAVGGGSALMPRTRGAGRVVLDGLIICGSLLCLSWMTVLAPLWHARLEPVGWLVNIAYPVGDIVIATIMFVLLGRVSRTQRLPIALLGCGVLAVAVADTGFTYLLARMTYPLASTIGIAWIGGFLLISLAGSAVVAERGPATREDAAGWPLLPYFPLVAAFTASAIVTVRTQHIDPVLYTASSVLTVLVIVRQLLNSRDNARLSGRLSEAVDGLRKLAFTDPITGLANRTQLIDDARELLAGEASEARQSGETRETRNAGESGGGLLLVGLRSLREINDALGRDAGDELLRQVGAVLRDVAGDHGTVARLGGHEFAVLVHRRDRHQRNLQPLGEYLSAIAQRIVDTLRRPCTVQGVPVLVEAHVGIAHIPGHGVDPSLLLRRADAAMSHGKQAHRAVQTWHHDLDMRTGEDLRILTELREGIAGGQLRLWYQLQVHADSGLPHGVEALVRWQHPRRGLLAPGAFIAAAERSTLIAELTDWVLDEAIAQAGRWRAAGEPLPVSVNVSAQCLADDDLPATVAALLAKHDLPARLLTVEVTETAVMADPEGSARRLAALRTLGVRVSIDDFGVGNTSLSLLTTLPIDELKLDRSFVSRVNDSPTHAAVVRTIADLGRQLGMLVVAEGVEDEETAETLRHLSFDLLQGFLYARPVPADKLPRGGAVPRSERRPISAAADFPADEFPTAEFPAAGTRPADTQPFGARRAGDVSDSVARRRLDDLTDVATLITAAPAALVILVRPHHLEIIGGDRGVTPDLPIEGSFCALVVENNRYMTIPDALADPRFVDHPTVRQAPGLRFFAGAPVHGGNGAPIGALCICDIAPRSMTTEQQSAIEALARLTTVLLGSRARADLEFIPAG